jgi:flavin reductase (DIM6/NTAB) family NADH-FMN oxidoreductase RutF
MASAENVDAVDRLAKTTGRKKVPLHKKAIGYRYEADKLNVSGFTTEASMSVLAPRLKECPVQLEAKLAKVVEFGRDNVKTAIPMGAFELNIEKVHVDESLLIEPNRPYVDPDKWHPLIMSFRKFYSTGDYIHESRLGQGSESQYAPWKKIGFKKKVLNWLLARNTHRYKQSLREHSDN